MSTLGKVLLFIAGAPSVVFYFFVVTIGQHISPLVWFGVMLGVLAVCGRRRRPGGQRR